MKKIVIAAFIVGLIIVGIYKTHRDHPERSFFTSWETPLSMCSGYCYSEAQNYSKVLQTSQGGCLCDNKIGHTIQRGYEAEMAGICEDKD